MAKPPPAPPTMANYRPVPKPLPRPAPKAPAPPKAATPAPKPRAPKTPVARLAETLAVDPEDLGALARASKRKHVKPEKRVRVDRVVRDPANTIKDGKVVATKPGKRKTAAASLAGLKPAKKGDVTNPWGRRGKSGCEGFTVKGLLKRTLERLTDQARESLLLGLIAKARVGDVQAIRLITELNDELLGTAAVLQGAVDEGVRISVVMPKKTELPRTADEETAPAAQPAAPAAPAAEEQADPEPAVTDEAPPAPVVSPNFCGAIPRKK